jgi:hypothetical protein
MNEEDLRDCFALMLTMGFAVKGEINPKAIWEIADMMIESRKHKESMNEEDDGGIVAVAPKRTRKR